MELIESSKDEYKIVVGGVNVGEILLDRFTNDQAQFHIEIYEKYRKMGYAKEATKKLLGMTNLGIRELVTFISDDNPNKEYSKKIVKDAGMTNFGKDTSTEQVGYYKSIK